MCPGIGESIKTACYGIKIDHTERETTGWWEKQKGSRGKGVDNGIDWFFNFYTHYAKAASAFYYGDPQGEMHTVSRVFLKCKAFE